MPEATADDDTLLELYRLMVLCRLFEERVLELRETGEVDGVVHPYIGQEAVAVGVCSQLAVADGVTSTHRGHGHCIAKGADPRRMMAELFGRVDGYCRGRGGSMHIADFSIGMHGANGIVSAGLPIAAGAALAARLDDTDLVSVSFFGDGAASAGPFHETINIAALWNLPLILVCENNGWSSATPSDAALAASGVTELAKPYRVPGERVDGNDVLAVRAAAGRAVDRARVDGPSVIEAMTYRIGGHAYRAVPPAERRSEETLEEWRERDPIAKLEAVLAERGVEPARWLELRDRCADEIEDAVAFARESPHPEPDDALHGVFAEAQ